MWTYKKKTDGSICLTGYDKTAEIIPEGRVEIPAQYDGFTVSELSYPFFYKNNDIEQVILPSTVTIIGSQTFQLCKNLYSVTLPEGLKEIRDSAFRSCGLEGLILPESLTKVGSASFAENTALETAIIKGKTEFEKSTFNGCTNLLAAEFHNVIQALPDYMFQDCAKLQTIQFPMRLKTIGNYFFLRCKLLDNIQLPDTIREIGAAAFSGCTSLRAIKIPDGVTEIKNAAFFECENLTDIKIPARMSKIEGTVFGRCTALQKVALPEGIPAVEHQMFEGCVSLQDVYIPSSVKKVGSNAFNNCKSLSKVYFGGSKEMWDKVVIEMSDLSTGNRYLTNSIMNRYWNQTAASIGF